MGRAGSRWRVLAASGLAALALNAVPAAAQDDPPDTPPDVTVVGPVTAGTRGPVGATLAPLAPFGYVEEEVFLQGTATIHGPAGLWGSNGEWATSDIGPAPYRTRLLVRRPADPAAFNGNVFVSWLNVGTAFDLDPEWNQVGEELMREGAAWVGVSAQTLGVAGPLGAARWDPARYGSLVLPGDNLSYDIFSQAGQALRAADGVDPLGGLPGERRLIATGQSQSAQRLVTYINAFHPTAQVYDGFLLVSRWRGAAPLGNAVLPANGLLDPDDSDDLPFLPDPIAALLSGPPLAKVRSDTDVPVFVVLTETEATQVAPVGRPDSDTYRTWEVAGTSHLDAAATDATVAKLDRDFPQVPLDQLECDQPNGFPTRYALRAAVRALGAWVEDGTEPPTAPPLSRDSAGELRRDADGNALGGLRLPDIEAPTAAHSGESDALGYCGLTGSTVPFTTEDLAERYPTPEAYVDAVTAAAAEAVEAGYLLPEDASAIVPAAPARFAAAAAEAATATDAATSSPAAPEARSSASSSGRASSGASSPSAAPAARAERSDRGWMATTGRDLITPVLIGLLLLLNGRVVLTVANQRRRAHRG